MTFFDLPQVITKLVKARDSLRQHYSDTALNFTLDGNLIGDIGEAIATELFEIKLESGEGIDGYTPTRKSVQIKATGTGGGANFRNVEGADFLLFFSLDFENLKGEIIYNGPEKNIRDLLPDNLVNQRSVSLKKLREQNVTLGSNQRLKMKD